VLYVFNPEDHDIILLLLHHCAAFVLRKFYLYIYQLIPLVSLDQWNCVMYGKHLNCYLVETEIDVLLIELESDMS